MINYEKAGTKQRTTSAKAAKKHQTGEKRLLTVNPGDKIAENPQTIEEKAHQLAVDAPDITGDHIKVPTYFIVEYPNGERKALHHVRDADQISDVIRQARFEEEDWSQQSSAARQETLNLNLSGFIFVVALVVVTIPILIGIF